MSNDHQGDWSHDRCGSRSHSRRNSCDSCHSVGEKMENLKGCYPCLKNTQPWVPQFNAYCIEKDVCPRNGKCGGPYGCCDKKHQKELCVKGPGTMTVKLALRNAIFQSILAAPELKKELKHIYRYLCEYNQCTEFTTGSLYLYMAAAQELYAGFIGYYVKNADDVVMREKQIKHFLNLLKHSIKDTYCEEGPDEKCYKHTVCCWKELRHKFKKFIKKYLKDEKSSSSSSSSSSSRHHRRRSGCRKRYHRPFFSSSSNDSSSYCAWD